MAKSGAMDRRAFAALAATSWAAAAGAARARPEPQVPGHGISFGPILANKIQGFAAF